MVRRGGRALILAGAVVLLLPLAAEPAVAERAAARPARDTATRRAALVAEDVAAPGAPIDVEAEARHESALVSWEEPADDGGAPVRSYTVTATPGGAEVTVTAPATETTVTGLANGTAYTFQVTAVNAAGSSTPSRASEAVTPAVTEPGAPTDVTASAVGDGAVSVDWVPPSYTGGAPTSGYTVVVEPGGRLVSAPADATSIEVPGLTSGTSYTFAVAAINAEGTGPLSTETAPVAPDGALTPQARVLSDAAVDTLTTVTPTTAVFTNAPAEVTGLQADNVILVAEAAQAPTGLLRKVTAVNTSAGKTTLTTTDATLPEAFRDGGISLLTQLRETPAARSNAALAGPQAEVEIPIDEVELAPGLKVDGKVIQNHAVGFDYHLLHRVLPSMAITDDVNLKTQLSLSAGRELTAFEGEKSVWKRDITKKVKFLKLLRKRIPVTVQAEVFVFAKGSVSRGTTVSASVEQDFRLRAESATQSGLITKTKPFKASVTPPSSSLAAKVDLGVRLEITPQLMGVDWYHAKLSGYVNETVEPHGTPRWKISGCVKGGVEFLPISGVPMKLDEIATVCTTLRQADAEAPTPPTNLLGNASDTCAHLGWKAATDNVAVVGYDVYRDGGKVASTRNLSARICKLRPNTAYDFTVRARDALGNVSASSNTVRLTTEAGSCTQPICGPRQVATSKDVPWGMAFLPDRSALISERDTFNIVRVAPSGQKTVVGRVPNVVTTNGHGGLLGIALSPNFASDGWVYIYHTAATDNRIVRMKYVNGGLTSYHVLLAGIPRNMFHNGGRLRFGPDGMLYAGTGDAQNGDAAQNTSSLAGKILRMRPDGKVPADNPFKNSYVWSYGHRNVLGLAFDSRGRLWAAEMGNAIMDEVNVIRRAGNYGWPACEGTSGSCGNPRFVRPARTFMVASASPGGLAIADNVLYMTALRGTRLWRMPITGSTTGTPKSYLQGSYGRLRTVEPAPGGLWLTTSTGDMDGTPNNSDTRILRLTLGE